MSDLFQNPPAKAGPVECLGITFPSHDARREHYLKLLAEKLKDPAFRKTEGFPIGSDENILALSDPPFYTACPNPFMADFVKHFSKSEKSGGTYGKEPFAVDVSEGKNDPIYNAHSYHTKVPHRAIMRYILHYTNPGDVILDSFCGTGMTGVAAHMCGNREVVESLGYRVAANGDIFDQSQSDGKGSTHPISKLGIRHAILNDLSPAASFIAFNYNTPTDIREFEAQSTEMLSKLDKSCGWMYETLHNPTAQQLEAAKIFLSSKEASRLSEKFSSGVINHVIWSDVFVCTDCAAEIIYWDVAIDGEVGAVRDEFKCQACGATHTKKSLDRAWVSEFDDALNAIVKRAKQVPVSIDYQFGTKRFTKKPDQVDFELLDRVSRLKLPSDIPKDRMPEGDETRRNDGIGVTHFHHFFTRRNIASLAIFRGLARGTRSLFLLTGVMSDVSRMSRVKIGYYFKGGGGPFIPGLAGTLYIPSVAVEKRPAFALHNRLKTVSRTFLSGHSPGNIVQAGSATALFSLPRASVDYLFFDPPFGANIAYADLNSIWESWLGCTTAKSFEAIESKSQQKNLDDYRRLMTLSFKEAYRVLKAGRWMTVEFSNTQASVWNAIQTSLQEAGFVVADVSALDKKQGSFKAVTTTTAVKQDLVISAYKPNGGLEERFSTTGGNEESAWDFARSHLKHLPTTKGNKGSLDFVAERDPRIIFDRMVSWFVRHGVPVPMSSQEFQAGLSQRFVERDGMVFLPDQVSEYDKKRALSAQAPQMELFVSDERSAIDWLTDFLKRRPSTYQEIHPEFITQLGAGWKKHEEKPELSSLLEANFIQYDGVGEVPSQIHSYLSTNHKDLRGLDKDNPQLVSKAKDRWFVPDPNKAQDLEKKREKALLKEFEGYQTSTGRKLKEFRLEVLRAGFKVAWGAKNYKAIIAIAQKIPEEALHEDEKLLLWYDQALTRTEAGA
jgi:DNA modification methylase